MSVSSDTKRKFYLIYHLSKADKPTLQDLASLTGIPATSIKRQLRSIRQDLGIKIIFVRDVHARGVVGHYVLEDWGILDSVEFLHFYMAISKEET